MVNFNSSDTNFSTKLLTGIEQNVYQLQCPLWPDMEAPNSTSVLLDLLYQTNEVQKTEAGTMLVHCSAGVGRSGTFIGLYKLINDYLNSEVSF